MIDAHVHFWNPARNDDILIVRRQPVLARRYMPEELLPELAAAGVTGAVAIQSAPNPDETAHLIDTSAAVAVVRAVVGWVDLTAPDAGARLDALRTRPKLVGVRAMLNRAPTVDWLALPSVRAGLVALAERDLTLDLIAGPAQIPAILQVAKALPNLRFVVDHGATPPTGRPEFGAWRESVARLAGETSARTKFSGLAEEAPEDWKAETLAPAFEHLLACFGTERIMWASNWPVIDLRGGYARWVAASMRLLDRADLTPAARAAILETNASEFYRAPRIPETASNRRG
jgi:L-fuconolactonase